MTDPTKFDGECIKDTVDPDIVVDPDTVADGVTEVATDAAEAVGGFFGWLWDLITEL